MQTLFKTNKIKIHIALVIEELGSFPFQKHFVTRFIKEYSCT